MERKIIHLNIADFSVAVERLLDRSLKSRALIVAQPSSRAAVYDMSDEAYSEGVRKGMSLSLACSRCRSALVLPPRPEQYRKAMECCLEKAFQYTPLVECSSGSGHLYLDVSGVGRLCGPPQDIGRRLHATMLRELTLDPIWSLAPNKLLAKVASRLVKPRGEYIVTDDNVSSFLGRLPLTIVPGIAPVDLHRLHHVNIRRIDQATALSVQDLRVLCDQRAENLYQILRGIDARPVRPATRAREEKTWCSLLTPDSNQEGVIRAALASLVQQAGFSLRRRQLGCRRLGVALQYTDGVAVSRQVVSPQPVDDDRALQGLALSALYRAWHRRVRLRKLELTCLQLQHPVQQLSLFALNQKAMHAQERDRRLSRAVDAIRLRCGGDKVLRGCQMRTDASGP
jgi:DNA polymerase-4